jgi:hypothetical protein
VLDLRLYRASLLAVLVAVLVAAFSLSSLPAPLSSPLPPAAFNGARALSQLTALTRRYPGRPPGSAADDSLAAYVAHAFRSDGFTVTVRWSVAATVSGERRIATVIATRRVAGGRRPVVLVAHRDAARGPAAGQLSATAALLELGRDLALGGARRPVDLVSTSGGSGGNAGAFAALADLPRELDAVIAIGDVASTPGSQLVIPWSPRGGAAPLGLQRTVQAALGQQLGSGSGFAGVGDQLARFAIPLTLGEQAPFEGAGVPAVLVQASGERVPSPRSPISPPRLTQFGRAILASVDALDRGPRIAAGSTRDLVIESEILGGWAARLIVGLLVLALAACSLDAFARARRQRVALAGWLGWVLWWAAPFIATLAFAKLLAAAGALPPLPPGPVSDGELQIGAAGGVSLAAVALFFLLAVTLRARLVRGSALDGSDATAGAPVALLCIASALAAILWIFNPYTAALLALPIAIWLPVLHADEYRSPRAGVVWLLCSLVPLGVVLGAESISLGLGPLGFFWTWLLVFAGGNFGLGALLAVSLAGAIALAGALLLIHPGSRGLPPDVKITVRGPITYAGPGSLGGTSSGRTSR